MSRGEVVLAGGAALGGVLAVVLAAGIRRRLGSPRLYAPGAGVRSSRFVRGREALSPDTLERLRLAAAL